MRRSGVVLVNLIVAVAMIAALETAARLYVWWRHGSQTAGLDQLLVHLIYEPFVMYGPRWDEVLNPARWPKRADVCRVLMVGGSTAAHFPRETLEGALKARVPGRSFEVINAALGGYEARQEVVVGALWAPALEPDVLLSLDGANDLEHRMRVSRPGEFFLSPTYAIYLMRPWLGPFAYLLSKSQLYNGIGRQVQRRSVASADVYADAIPVYIEAQRSLNAIAKGTGAARLMMLQPFSAFKSPQSPEEAAFRPYKYREDVMKELFERTNQQLLTLARMESVRYIDGRQIYRDDPQRIFIDDVHLTGRGYERLADVIANEVALVAGSSRCKSLHQL